MLRATIVSLLIFFGVRALVRGLFRWPGLWAGAVRRFEHEPIVQRAVVFLGSSSIRFWETLARDMAPLPVVNRGFGGATTAGVNLYARRILARTPDPRAIVLYVGVNDLALGVGEHHVVEEIQRFLAIAREVAPRAPVYLLSLQRTPSRRRGWPKVRRVNERLAQIAQASRGAVRFIDVATVVLDPAGRPRRELFVLDGIHMRPGGYALWTSVVRPRLLADLGPVSGTRLGS